jgi:hypothetical protein
VSDLADSASAAPSRASEEGARFPLAGLGRVRADQPRIGVAGDIVLGTNADRVLGRVAETAWRPLKDWVRDLDLLIMTFDTAFPGPDPKAWEPRIFAGVDSARSLPVAKRTLFNLANNHSMDGGWGGLCAAREAFAARGIDTIGGGRSRDEAERPWSTTIGREQIIVHAAAHHGCHPRPPLADGGQVASVDSPSWWERVDTSMGAGAFVMVVLHGGVQGSHYPSPTAIEISRALVARGVNVVVWSHAHAVQGVVRTERGFVAYGLGNAMYLPLEGDPVRPHPVAGYDQGLYLELEPDARGLRHAEGMLFRRVGLCLEPVAATAARRRWFGALCGRPAKRSYPAWWRAYRFKQDVIDATIRYLVRDSFWKQLAAVRPHHAAKLLAKLANARRDARDV